MSFRVSGMVANSGAALASMARGGVCEYPVEAVGFLAGMGRTVATAHARVSHDQHGSNRLVTLFIIRVTLFGIFVTLVAAFVALGFFKFFLGRDFFPPTFCRSLLGTAPLPIVQK